MQMNHFSGIQAGIKSSPNLSRMAAKPAGPIKFGFQSMAAEDEGAEGLNPHRKGAHGPIAFKKQKPKMDVEA